MPMENEQCQFVAHHPLHNFASMAGREMGVSHGHAETFVPQNHADLMECGATFG